jgi:arylsulfatase A-like enzyme
VFSDHTDVRPTLLHLAGLRDDYAHDGRVLVEVLDEATPQRDTFTRLASAYKAINAPVGELGRKTLELSTRALVSDDATYATLEEQLTSITAQRNALAARMSAVLESAAFDRAPINEDEARDLIQAADTLIEGVP